MKIKKTSIILFFTTFISYSQQIGDGYAPAIIPDFSAPLKSGIYNGLNTSTVGMTPDNSQVWQHLFAARHIGTTNNYQLQIASSFAVNDRLFFRKIIASTLVPSNSTWIELATRGNNNFIGNQIINGNVGIGTGTPSSNLEIAAPALDDAETLLKVRITDASQDYFKITNSTLGAGQFIPNLYGYHVSDNRASLYLVGAIESSTDNGTNPIMVFDSRLVANPVTIRPLFSWDSYGNKKMVLNSNGSLGIGTTITGNHKLAVEGSIGAREIKVQATGWSDFVFKKEYTLPTLEEVEKHINEKGHLQDIPSEEDVLKNGINLGEMNSKLLQKIEELTLYMIEMKKENESLRNNQKDLEEKFKKFETR